MHEIIHVGGMSITFLHTRHETADALDVFELTILLQQASLYLIRTSTTTSGYLGLMA